MRPSAVLAAVALVLSIGLSGCGGGEKKDYAVPASLCGVPVEPELLEPLLPSGEEISVQESGYENEVQRRLCTVTVDGDVSLTVNGEWREAGFTALEAGEDHVAGGGEFQTSANGSIASWGTIVATTFPCDNATWQAYSAVAEERVRTGSKASVEALKKFIAPYGEALAKTLPCEDST
ncbi:hypothetical protein [Streptomyces sp. NBC_01506]|uniref:hypothetical protein n=1 Tax=Streptomyces sp. NBC_01506 TaxID=2903887 RepID=UPI003867C828